MDHPDQANEFPRYNPNYEERRGPLFQTGTRDLRRKIGDHTDIVQEEQTQSYPEPRIPKSREEAEDAQRS